MKLLLIRGLPGSGKSTLAKATGYWHLEIDNYFLDHEGKYQFDESQLPEAHKWCETCARNFLRNGLDVVVSNTFVRKYELQPYLDIAAELGAEVKIVVAKGDFGSGHGVTQETIDWMREQWEE